MQEKVNEVKELNELYGSLMADEEFKKMWLKMHTPRISNTKIFGHSVGRNDICPYCSSGKKFKKCECYTQKVGTFLEQE